MKDNINTDDTMDAVWTVDSETSEKVLMDRKTNKILVRIDPKDLLWLTPEDLK